MSMYKKKKEIKHLYVNIAETFIFFQNETFKENVHFCVGISNRSFKFQRWTVTVAPFMNVHFCVLLLVMLFVFHVHPLYNISTKP